MKRLFSHEIFQASSIMFIGSFIGNILAFIFNLFLAHNLTTSDYGIYASLTSIIALVSIPGGAINTTIIKFATEYFAKNKIPKALGLYKSMLSFLLILGAIIIVIFILLIRNLENFLHISNPFYIISSAIIVGVGFVSIINSAFLQSLLKFKILAFLSVFSNLLKLVSGIILVILGFKVLGGLGALFFSTLGPFILGFIPLKFIFSAKKSDDISIIKIIKYGLPTTAALLSISSFIFTDIILVKHFFSPNIAGLYAGGSLIGKVIFYFTAVIPMAMLPILIKKAHTGKNIFNSFYLSFILTILPSLFITGLYFIFPKVFITLFLGGQKYFFIADLIGLFGIYILTFNIANLFLNFFLSIHKTKIFVATVISAVIQVVLIYIFHETLRQVLIISISTLVFLNLIFLGYFFYIIKSFHNSKSPLRTFGS